MPDAAPARIFTVDDDEGLLRLIEKTLKREGFIMATASSAKDAIAWLTHNTADLMLLDLKLQDVAGSELISHLESVNRLLPFIIITGQGDERVAVEMMKRGALDYLVKGVDFLQFVPEVVRRALDHLAKEKRLAKAELHEHLQYATTRVLAESVTVAEASLKVLQAVSEIMGWDFGENWNLNRDAQVLEFVETWQQQAITSFEFASMTRQTTLVRGVGLPGRVWASGQPAWIPDIARDSNCPRGSTAMKLGLRSGFAFPILLNSEVLGVMGFFGRNIREPETELAGIFLAIGSQIGQFIERKRAEETVRRSEAMLGRAQEIAHVGGYEINVPGTGGEHWSAETFRILGLDPATKELPSSEYVSRCVHLEDQARVREIFDKSLNERVRFDVEYRIVRPDGSIRHVHSIVEPAPGADKQVVKLIGTLQDVTERKELEKRILEISEREQSRIGQDLHDGLCQHLAGIEFRLLGLKQKLEGKSSRQAAETTELAKLVRDGIEQTRTLARGLSPVMLESGGLMNALQELAVNTEKAFNISCGFSCPAPVLTQNNAVATHLYRIAQEAVQNAIRHGQAKFIVINLLTANDRIVLAVRDDGVGFPKKPRKNNGMGLRIMQYRAGMVGGSLVVQRDPEGGTSVVCSLRAAVSAPETTREKPNDSGK